MPVVFVPALLQDLTGGAERVNVPGETVSQAIESLEARYPGIKARLCEGDRLRPNIAVSVDGEVSFLKLRHKLDQDSEVHFFPNLSGG